MKLLRLPAYLVLLSLPLLTASRAARADEAQDKAAAEVLFEDALKLVEAQQYDQACPKLAESARLARGVGVLLYLGDCYEHELKTASAWIEFRDAEDLANQRGNRKRAAIAHGRAEKLSPMLANVALTVAPEAIVPGLVVRRDGEVVGSAQYGLSLPIDPGRHTLEASAPNKKTWSHPFDVMPATKTSVAVPPLEDAPLAVAPPPVDSNRPATTAQAASHPLMNRKTQRIVSYVVGGVGVVGVGIGSVFGGLAMSKLNASNAAGDCAPDNHCSAAGATLRYAAEDRATVSTIGFIAGGALLAGGVVLFFTAPKGTSGVEVTASPTVAGATFGVGGHFD